MQRKLLGSAKEWVLIMNSDGMGIMNFDVMDTAFHSGDEWDTMSVEVSPVLRSE